MQVEPIRAFEDNYIWSIVTDAGIIIVDPGEPAPVLSYLNNQEQPLKAILITHEHSDHTGGVKELLEKYPDITVIGPDETAELVQKVVKPEETFELLGESFKVIDASGHTNGHIAFLVNDCLFCGDSLFMAGCGRVFTKDYQAAYDTVKRFAELPDKTAVYAGHEYSKKNLNFALSVDEDQPEITSALHKVEKQLAEDEPSLPSTIGLEKQINLFMQAESLEEFKTLRDKRDQL